jgi:hypothetical protein
MICEHEWADIDKSVREMKMQHFQNANLEIHTANIFKQKGDFKDYSETHCYQILGDVYDLIAKCPVTLFSVLIDKRILNSPEDDPELATWEMLLERIQLSVASFCRGNGRDEYAMILMDQKDPARDESIRNYVKYCQIYGTEYISKLDRIVDEPSFTPSKWRNLTQLADAVTYCFKNHHIGEPFFTEQFSKILPRYHSNGAGKIEGYGIKIRA